jgi:hypothetical protein
MEQFIDDNAVTCFEDDNAVSHFVDDDNNELFCERATGRTRKRKHVAFNA